MDQLKIAKGAKTRKGVKIVIIGGHLAPALSVIEALPRETNILFIGRKYSLEGDNALSLEYQTITSRGIPFIGLIYNGFPKDKAKLNKYDDTPNIIRRKI